MKLIESSNIWNNKQQILKMVKDVSENCTICKRYKRRKLKPIVSLPLASEFNHTVAMDLITYESPWSNNVCERHNAVIKESVRKTMEDTGCKLKTAVVWAVSAKNSLSGHQGYSPNMLVFGRNPNYPNVLTNELPALETQISSVTVENNLKAMNSAREASIQSECSKKIRRALKHKVKSCNDAIYENGFLQEKKQP